MRSRGLTFHDRKWLNLKRPLTAFARAIKNEDLEPVFDIATKHSAILDQKKQLGFYSDCLGKSHWWIPGEEYDENIANAIVGYTRGLANNIKHTEKEIELFIKHLGPLAKSNNFSNMQAIDDWLDEVNNAGLSISEIMGFGEFPNPKE